MGCERYVKSLDGYTHFVVMLFGVLKHFDSLRELERCLRKQISCNTLESITWLGVVL